MTVRSVHGSTIAVLPRLHVGETTEAVKSLTSTRTHIAVLPELHVGETTEAFKLLTSTRTHMYAHMMTSMIAFSQCHVNKLPLFTSLHYHKLKHYYM